MERVETLLQKLQQLHKEKAPLDQLLLTTQMLQHELIHLQSKKNGAQYEPVVVSMPLNVLKTTPVEKVPEVVPAMAAPREEEKTVTILEVNEDEVAAELEEIRRNAAAMQQMIGKSKPQLLFDTEETDVPTLTHQNKPRGREINQSVAGEVASLNDRLKEIKIEISEKLTDTPVKDLKKAIGINDRFLYINDLFRGDEAMYERSIKTINGFSIWPEAEYWIRRELKTKLGWTDDNGTVKQFDQLVKRRFS
ncbi:MAG: hypothetical protein V4725_06550 [Bacteroidota bacterium]